MLEWTFDPGKEIPIECHAYRPAVIVEPAPTCRLSWRLVGQLLAGALWGGCAVGVLLAIITAL